MPAISPRFEYDWSMIKYMLPYSYSYYDYASAPLGAIGTLVLASLSSGPGGRSSEFLKSFRVLKPTLIT